MKSFPKPWVFVLTGVLFNISSAVITHYFVGLNNERINELDRFISARQVLIDSLWQSKIEVERKKEFFALYLVNRPIQDSPDIKQLDQYYQDYLLETVQTYDLNDYKTRVITEESNNLELLLALSRAAQLSIIESINHTYFEKLDLEENKMPIEQGNVRLFSIAIFLQVTGLILILARDFKKN